MWERQGLPRSTWRTGLGVSAISLLVLAHWTLAQTSRPTVFGAGISEDERQKVIQQYYQKQVVDPLKDPLGASDEEWKVLAPKCLEVVTLRRNLYAATPYGALKPETKLPDEMTPDDKKTELQKATINLRKLLLDKSTKPQDLQDALKAYRDARAEVKKQLEKAQKALRDLLTVRQEAALVLDGQLE
jgi:hypothetical protein